MGINPQFKFLKAAVLLLLLCTMVNCQRKKTVAVLEERVILLEAALIANQQLLARLIEEEDDPTPIKETFPPVGDARMPADAPQSAETDNPHDGRVEILEPLDEHIITESRVPHSPPDEEMVHQGVPMETEPEGEPIPALTTQQVPAAYKQAYSAYNARDFTTAATTFRNILHEHKEHKLAPNAAYWLAEVAYSKYNYHQAIVLFQQVVDNYPKSHKAPDAMLKIGKCRERLGQDEAAIETYRNLIDAFPDSRAAGLARSWF